MHDRDRRERVNSETALMDMIPIEEVETSAKPYLSGQQISCLSEVFDILFELLSLTWLVEIGYQLSHDVRCGDRICILYFICST